MLHSYSGLIIGVKNNGDSNRIIEVLTADYGSVYVLASGARRLSSRFLSLTNIFTLVTLECDERGDLKLLRDGKCLGGFRNIETDLEKFSVAANVIKCTRIVAADSDNKNRIYGLNVIYFQSLDKCGNFDEDRYKIISLTVKFYIYLLHYIGFDAAAYAAEYENGKSLADICEHLSGKRISDTMQSDDVFENASAAYRTLQSIYAEQLDIRIDNI